MARAWLMLLGLCFSPTLPAQSQFTLDPQNPAGIDPPAALLATWGSAEQCAAPGTDSVALHRYPFEVGREWLRQGPIYCYLTWLSSQPLQGGSETQVFAQCGEDTLREYRVFFLLRDQRLRIRWSADFTTPELERCRAMPGGSDQ